MLNKINKEILLIDTESTGKASEEEKEELISFAYTFHNSKKYKNNFYKPNVKIKTEAKAIHFIDESDLVDSPSCDTFDFKKEFPDVKYIVAYNTQYDYKMISSPEGIVCIDLLYFTKELFKDLSNHKLSTIYFAIQESKNETIKNIKKTICNAHNALTDVKMLEVIWEYVIEKYNLTTIEQVKEMENNLSDLKVFSFGKHKGKDIKEIELKYLSWIWSKEDLTDDVRKFIIKAFSYWKDLFFNEEQITCSLCENFGEDIITCINCASVSTFQKEYLEKIKTNEEIKETSNEQTV